MKKFWNVEGKEILIYGKISNESWLGDEVTPKQLAQEIRGIDGDITVRINSMGGDVFAAQTMYTLLKEHMGEVIVKIDGICASAATIIACAGSRVIMAANGLYMIHNPMTYVAGLKEAGELEEVASVLRKITSTIVEVYKKKSGLNEAEIEELTNKKTYLTASEALEKGLIDEIGEKIEVENRNGNLYVNKMEANEMRAYYRGAKEVNTVKTEISEAIKAERERISALLKLKTGNIYTDSLIEMAIEDGTESEKTAKYIEKMRERMKKQEYQNHYMANETSGAEQVGLNCEPYDEIEEIVRYGNRMRCKK